MFRYFACVWNPSSPKQTETSVELQKVLHAINTGWCEALTTPGLYVACADAQPRSLQARCLHNGLGVVLGTLFERSEDLLDDRPMPHAQLDEQNTSRIVRSQLQHLVDFYWGNYVAIVRGADAAVSVLVSPGGSLPCLSTRLGGVIVLFSCITDVIGLQGLSFTPSHQYLKERVLGRMPDDRNPLHEVTRLLRGEGIRFQLTTHPARIERRMHWSPRTFYEMSDPIEDPELAERAMRSVIRACTRTLAADHDNILVRLSGGLDSSIIAGCLRGCENHAAVRCYTYFGANTIADVRPWARLSAAHNGYALTEHVIDPAELALPSLDRLAPSADAVSLLEYLGRAQLERTLCEENCVSAVFTGDGGDSGFCSDTVALSLVEHLNRHGLSARMWSLAHEISMVTQRSAWQVLRRSLRHWRYGGRAEDQNEAFTQSCKLVAEDLRARPDLRATIAHPWFRDFEDMPWMLLYQVGALPFPPPERDLSVDASAFVPEVLQPLYAQPVIELLLRIPVYVHFADGRDRGLARLAFREEIPTATRARLWKDRAPGFLPELISQHRSWLRDTLLDGVLVSARLLNRAAVERALSSSLSKDTVHPTEIFRHLDTELWARHWLGLSDDRFNGPASMHHSSIPT